MHTDFLGGHRRNPKNSLKHNRQPDWARVPATMTRNSNDVTRATLCVWKRLVNFKCDMRKYTSGT